MNELRSLRFVYDRIEPWRWTANGTSAAPRHVAAPTPRPVRAPA